MSRLEFTFGVLDSLLVGDSSLNLTSFRLDPLTQGYSNVDLTGIRLDPVTEGYSNLELTSIRLDPISEGYSNLQLVALYLQALIPAPLEEYMTTDTFPGFGNSTGNPSVPAALNPFNSALPGLSFSVHKKPGFNTRITPSSSGPEVRNARMRYPIWDFELTYEFLEDSSGSESSLKTMLGFFLQMQGSFGQFLFKDPDDYLVAAGAQGVGDGVTTEFPICRVLGGFSEQVGQIDTANSINFWSALSEDHTVPANPGPYEIVVTHAADFVEDQGVTRSGIPMTKVASAPATGEYSVNELTGTYTFSADDELDEVVISYQFLIPPADYTVTLPNRLVFDVAPAEGAVITGSFQFFFVCRFTEDQQDYEKFMDKLWNLQTCDFRSIIQ